MYEWFLVALAELRKATISLALSVCLSINMAQVASHSKNFNEIWYLRLFENRQENSILTKIW